MYASCIEWLTVAKVFLDAGKLHERTFRLLLNKEADARTLTALFSRASLSFSLFPTLSICVFHLSISIIRFTFSVASIASTLFHIIHLGGWWF